MLRMPTENTGRITALVVLYLLIHMLRETKRLTTCAWPFLRGKTVLESMHLSEQKLTGMTFWHRRPFRIPGCTSCG
jgi:hypothetical protein